MMAASLVDLFPNGHPAGLVDRVMFYSRLLREGDLGAGAQAVAFALLFKFFNSKTGECFPGQTTLAAETGLTVRHVQRAIRELRVGGWFDTRPGQGIQTRHGKTTAYRPLMDRDDESVTPDQPVTPDRSVRQGVTDRSSKLSKEELSRSNPDFSGATAKEFESFWQLYPKRKGGNPKKPARLKYEAAIKRGIDPAVILRGLEGYAAEQQELGNVGTPYIKTAVVWLNQDGWEEYAERPIPSTAPQPGMF